MNDTPTVWIDILSDPAVRLAARRRLQAEDFNLTLQQTRVILHHLPQWFATEDPRIVNTLLHRLCTRIYITPDNTALPEFRTP